MKSHILPLVFSILLISCYTSSSDKSDNLLFRGTNAYYNSRNEYMTRCIFEEVANRKESVSNAQRAYAIVYLAKLKLKHGDINSAINLLEKAENICKDFPYKYELMRDFYKAHNNHDAVKKYNELLSKWINYRINELDNNTFDIDNLEFINVRSYVNGEFEREFFPMYDLKKPKEFRIRLYKKYLNDKLLDVK